MTELAAPLLSTLIFVPLATGAGLLALTGLASLARVSVPYRLWRVVAVLSSLVSFALACGLWRGYDPTRVDVQFVERVAWLPMLGIDLAVGIDGISLLLILMTTFLVPLVLLAKHDEATEGRRAWIFLVLLIEGGLVATFAAQGLVQFLVSWELVLLAAAGAVARFGTGEAEAAASRLLLTTMTGGALLWIATLVVGDLHAAQFGAWRFDLVVSESDAPTLLSTTVPIEGAWWQTQRGLLVAFALGFALRSGLAPFHGGWSAAATSAPAGGAVLLGPPLLAVAAYGFVRVALPLLPEAAGALAPLALVLALLALVYGTLLAWSPRTLRGLAATFGTIQLAVAVLGLFALNLEGIEGAILHLVNLGLILAAWWFLIGMLEQRRGTSELGEFGGIAKPMPVFALLLGLAALAAAGLPLLNGFVSEFLVLLGTFQVDPRIGLAAAAGLAVLAAAVFRAVLGVVAGPVENPQNRGLIDLDGRERAILLALLVPILWIGLHPETFLKRLHPSVLEVLRVMEERTTDSAVTWPEPSDPGRMLPAARR